MVHTEHTAAWACKSVQATPVCMPVVLKEGIGICSAFVLFLFSLQVMSCAALKCALHTRSVVSSRPALAKPSPMAVVLLGESLVIYLTSFMPLWRCYVLVLYVQGHHRSVLDFL